VQSGGTWVLVGTGWQGRAELIRSAAETLFGAGARPRAIVLTHVHPDHAGSASELARLWDVTVYVHPGELPLPPSGRIIGALARVERRWMFPSGQDGLSPINPDVGIPGLPDWQVIATPRHTPGHLALFREGDRALIPGDAVLTVNLNALGDALSQRHTSAGHRALPPGTGEQRPSLCLNWPGWSQACWRRTTENRWPARYLLRR
jgi:glyoxylase-like metal-dependent hydrolase (beta-lactamase superfamily II)